MFVSNPFAELSATMSPSIMQTFLWLMVLCVVGGTIFDIIHKGSAKYFFANWGKSQDQGARAVGGGEVTGLAVKTLESEVLTSSEFCNPNRRISHLLGMYGFVAYVVSTFVMVMWYPTAVDGTPAIWPFLWTLGALMICVGGYWFWFFIRVDVNSEGNSPFRLVRADLFILSLLASATFGILWQLTQANGSGWSMLFLALYLIATVVLFAGVPWSKFSHMFFKPAAALQKRVAKANGTLDNLPAEADRNNPADRDRHSMELLKDAPMNMGLGIKREQPNHY
jgi:uncharacterized membrane protein